MKLFFTKPVIIVLLSLIIIFTCAEDANALMLKMSFEELSSNSESIIIGKVKNIDSYWNEERTNIYTEVTVSIEDDIKGVNKQDEITIITPGGEVDGITQYVSDSPTFKLGEEAVLFLNELSSQNLSPQQIQPGTYQVTGSSQGKIDITDSSTNNITINTLEERLETEESSLASDSGFVYNGFSWPGTLPTAIYYVNAPSAKNTQIQAAAETWNKAGANFTFQYAGTHSRSGKSAKNGVNEIMWYNLGKTYILAQATIWFSGDKILENDMVFNTMFKWGATDYAIYGYHDVQSVALHEFGHWLSLGHSHEYGSIMYFYTKSMQRNLHSVDIAGIQYIYGEKDLDLEEYSISTYANPEEGGTISGSGIYTEGQLVTLRAEASPGYIFTNWTSGETIISNDPNYTFIAGSDKSLSANFYPLSNRRIAGSNRYQTAVNISETGWPDGSDTVILASGQNFPDALAGVPLAYHLDCPILLTSQDSLDSYTKSEIERLGSSRVIILGGPGAVSLEIETELPGIVTDVDRLGGEDRYATSVKIAEELAKHVEFDTSFITYNDNFPDALAAASYAAINGQPILLTSTNNLPVNTDQAIIDLGITSTIVVGGTSVISDTVLDQLPDPIRISGTNRYETAYALAESYFPDQANELFIATGLDFPDALAGSMLTAGQNSGMLLVPGSLKAADYKIIDFITSRNINGVTVFGGDNAVSSGLIAE